MKRNSQHHLKPKVCIQEATLACMSRSRCGQQAITCEADRACMGSSLCFIAYDACDSTCNASHFFGLKACLGVVLGIGDEYSFDDRGLHDKDCWLTKELVVHNDSPILMQQQGSVVRSSTYHSELRCLLPYLLHPSQLGFTCLLLHDGWQHAKDAHFSEWWAREGLQWRSSRLDNGRPCNPADNQHSHCQHANGSL